MHPFSGEIRDGVVWGRGAVDMKGGVASILGAVRAITAAGLGERLAGEILVASVPSEEDGGQGMLAAIRAGATGDMAVITEPTGLDIVIAHAGAITFRLTVPPDFNYARDVVDAWAKRDPDKTALVWVDPNGENRRELSFRDMSLASNRVANALQSLGALRALRAVRAAHDFDDPARHPTAGPHDAYIQVHPATGERLAHLAYGTRGYVVVNADDVAMPRFVAHWEDWSVFGEGAPERPYVHEALPIEGLWDGRHYTILGEECGAHRIVAPSCYAIVLDTTDPAAPTFVGAWTLPVDVEWSGLYQFSLHYMALVDRTLFVSTYHGGLWAVDLSTPEALRTMPTIGVFVPDRDSPQPRQGPTRSGLLIGVLYENLDFDVKPMIADVNVLSDGTLIVYDANTGLVTRSVVEPNDVAFRVQPVSDLDARDMIGSIRGFRNVYDAEEFWKEGYLSLAQDVEILQNRLPVLMRAAIARLRRRPRRRSQQRSGGQHGRRDPQFVRPIVPSLPESMSHDRGRGRAPEPAPGLGRALRRWR